MDHTNVCAIEIELAVFQINNAKTQQTVNFENLHLLLQTYGLFS